MTKNKGHLINNVLPDSIAEEMEIEAGDYLLEINGEILWNVNLHYLYWY